MATIHTDHHPRDWNWRRMVNARKGVVLQADGRAFIVALTENNPDAGACWVGVPAEQDEAGGWRQVPSSVPASVTVMNRAGTRFVAWETI